jgi:hypothetical protein
MTPVGTGRPAAVLAALAAAMLLGVGCGAHGRAHASASPRRPAATATSPTGVTLAREQAFAQAVNLTRADVPGFTLTSEARERETPSQKRLQRQLDACLGGGSGSGSPRYEASSGQFRRHAGLVDVTVSSAVTFFASAAQAGSEVTLLRSGRTAGCLSAYLDARYGGRRLGAVVIGHVKVQQGTPPAPGTSGGFAWRIDAPLHLRGVSVPFYLDMLGFVYGQAEVRLVSSSVIAPFPAAGQEDLFRLLLARATARHT